MTNINDYNSYEECENEEDYHQLFITLPETTLLTPNKFIPDPNKNKLQHFCERPIDQSGILTYIHTKKEVFANEGRLSHAYGAGWY